MRMSRRDIQYACVQCGDASRKGGYQPSKPTINMVNTCFRRRGHLPLNQDEYALAIEALRKAPRCPECLHDYVDRRRLGLMVSATSTQNIIYMCH
jgi:ribosomal protein L37AE/L43A